MHERQWLVVAVLLAALPRFAWYRTHQPELPPDTFGYLNVAREWRGARARLAIACDVPTAAKLGPIAFLISAVGTSLLAHTENRRFAAPIVPLVLASGVLMANRAARGVTR